MRSQRKASQAPTIDHEHIAHAQMLRGYPAFVATWVPGPSGETVSAKVVHGWWQRKLIFALRNEGHYVFPVLQFERGAPKSIVGRLLKILRPRGSWYAMCWLVAHNPWLAGASPIDLLDDDPAAVLDAACYPYC